jgi:hypothetical protein
MNPIAEADVAVFGCVTREPGTNFPRSAAIEMRVRPAARPLRQVEVEYGVETTQDVQAFFGMSASAPW